MELSKKNKTLNAFAIAVFTVIRVVMFSYFPNLSDKTPYIPFILLIAAFAVLSAVIATKISDRTERKADAVLLLMSADFFFTLQNDAAFLAVAVMWEVCALIALIEKKTVVKEIIIIAASFASALLLPNTAFSYVLLAAFVYFMANRKESAVKAAAVAAVAVVSGIAGFAVHNSVLKDTAEFSYFINTFTMGSYGQTVFAGFAVIIPTVILSIVLIKMLVTCSKTDIKASSAADIKNRKKEMQLYIIGAAVLFAVFAAGLIMKKFDMYLLINQLVPVLFITMILNKNAAAEKTVEKINAFFSEHSFAALLIFIAVFAVQMACLDDAGLGGAVRDNISRLIF